MIPESWITSWGTLGGDQSGGQPGTAMVGLDDSIQLYEDKCSTFVMHGLILSLSVGIRRGMFVIQIEPIVALLGWRYFILKASMVIRKG